MKKATSNRTGKIILYALAVLAVIVSILGAGFLVLVIISSVFIGWGNNEKEGGPIPYWGLNPPYPPQWSADGTTILRRSAQLVSIGDNDTDLDYIKDIHHPSISPDGTRLAFSTLRHGDNYEIGVSNLDGSNYRRLTKTRYFKGNPVWSPDGTRIAFLSDRRAYEDESDNMNPGETFNLYTMASDGSNVRSLVPAVGVHGYRPTWSPDGSMLAFVGNDYENRRDGIYTVGVEGSDLIRLTLTESAPAWSPDGRTIAFLLGSEQPGGATINVINPDGSGLREIISINHFFTASGGIYLSWSPDGTEILTNAYPFIAARVDGSGYRVFSDLEGVEEAYASWSPNGLRIAVGIGAFQDYEDETRVSLFTMAPDGSDKRALLTFHLGAPDERGWRTGWVDPAHGAPLDTEAGWVWYSSESQSNASADTSVLVGPPNSLPHP